MACSGNIALSHDYWRPALRSCLRFLVQSARIMPFSLEPLNMPRMSHLKSRLGYTEGQSARAKRVNHRPTFGPFRCPPCPMVLPEDGKDARAMAAYCCRLVNPFLSQWPAPLLWLSPESFAYYSGEDQVHCDPSHTHIDRHLTALARQQWVYRTESWVPCTMRLSSGTLNCGSVTPGLSLYL